MIGPASIVKICTEVVKKGVEVGKEIATKAPEKKLLNKFTDKLRDIFSPKKAGEISQQSPKIGRAKKQLRDLMGDRKPDMPEQGSVEKTEDYRATEQEAATEHCDPDKSLRQLLGDRDGLGKPIMPTENCPETEIVMKNGGRYSDVKKYSDGETHEVHHMPADSVSPLERDDGPAIKMEKEDHRQTASCGNAREAREYRAKQKELLEQGKLRDAVQMDIDDIHSKFGDKYDDAISEMLEYVNELEKGGSYKWIVGS